MDENGSLGYIPKHPLPDEIQTMNHEDTICKYCGISYLIHNEIKRLQNLLDESKKEVERLQHYDERENKLKEDIRKLEKQIEELSAIVEVERKSKLDNDKKLEKSNEEILRLEALVEENKSNLQVAKADWELKMSHMKSSCSAILADLNCIICSYEEIAESFKLYKQQFPLNMENLKNAVVAKFETSISGNSELAATKIQEMQNESYIQTEKHKMDIEDVANKLHSEYEKDLKRYKEEHDKSSETYRHRYKVEIEKLNENLQLLSSEKSDLFKQVDYLKSQNEKNMTESKQTISNLKEHITKSDQEIGVLKDMNDKDEKTMRFKVKKQEEEIQALRNERTKTIEAHQYRIQQLRESFAEKLKEADGWPEELQRKLEESERAHVEEQKLLLKRLKSDHKQEVDKLEASFKEQMAKEKKNLEKKENDLKTKMESLQQQFENELKMMYSNMDNIKARHSSEVNQLEEEIDRLKQDLHRLHEAKQQQNSFSNDDKDRYDQMICELREALESSRDQVDSKESQIREYKSEVVSLRDCVRRECEERYELTEALSNARTELLSMQRFQPTNNKTPDILPTPPSQGRKSTISTSSSSEENWTKARSRKSITDKNNSTETSASLASFGNSRRKQNSSSSFKHKLKLSLKNS